MIKLFFKKIKLQFLFLLLALFIIPTTGYAYSKYIVPGGQTIGIEVNSDGILVVGFYKVDEQYIGKDAGFEVGDSILAINDQKVTTIEEMVQVVNQEARNNAINSLDVTIERN